MFSPSSQRMYCINEKKLEIRLKAKSKEYIVSTQLPPL